MTDLLITLIILIMGSQFGVALTSSIIVHPILKMVTRPSAIQVFKPFFDKTHKAVLAMSIVVSILALVLSILTKNWWWFGISVLMHLNGPYTLKFMMPTNRRLMGDDVLFICVTLFSSNRIGQDFLLGCFVPRHFPNYSTALHDDDSVAHPENLRKLR